MAQRDKFDTTDKKTAWQSLGELQHCKSRGIHQVNMTTPCAM